MKQQTCWFRHFEAGNYFYRVLYVAVACLPLILFWFAPEKRLLTDPRILSWVMAIIVIGLKYFIVAVVIQKPTLTQITREKESKTLLFLLSTPLSDFEIIVRKLLAFVIPVAVTLFSTFPLLVFFHCFGGISWTVILLDQVSILLSLCSVAAIGMRISVRAETTKAARGDLFFLIIPLTAVVGQVLLSNSMSLIIFLHSMSPALGSALHSLLVSPSLNGTLLAICCLHPAGLVLPILQLMGVPFFFYGANPLPAFVVGFVAQPIIIAWFTYRSAKALRPEGLGWEVKGKRKKFTERWMDRFRRFRPPIWEDWPLLWKDLFIGRLSIFMSMLMFPIIFIPVVFFSSSSFHQSPSAGVLSLIAVFGVFLAFTSVSSSISFPGFLAEQDFRTQFWEQFRITPIAGRHSALSRWWVVQYRLMPRLVLAIVCWVLFRYQIVSVWTLIIGPVSLIAFCWALACTGIWSSFLARSHKEVWSTQVAVFLLLLVGLIVIGLINAGIAMIAAMIVGIDTGEVALVPAIAVPGGLMLIPDPAITWHALLVLPSLALYLWYARRMLRAVGAVMARPADE